MSNKSTTFEIIDASSSIESCALSSGDICDSGSRFLSTAHLLAPGAAREHLELVQQVVEGLDYQLIRLKLAGYDTADQSGLFQVMASRADGSMTIEDCTKLSRALSAVFEDEAPVFGAYTLEVSSPGTTRPLTRISDFETYIGHDVHLELITSIEGRKKFDGTLAGFVDGEVLMLIKLDDHERSKTIGFHIDSIARIRLLEDIDALKADLKGRRMRK